MFWLPVYHIGARTSISTLENVVINTIKEAFNSLMVFVLQALYCSLLAEGLCKADREWQLHSLKLPLSSCPKHPANAEMSN